MASLFDLEQSALGQLAAATPQQTGASAFQSSQFELPPVEELGFLDQLSSSLSDIATGAFDVGTGALFDFFDLLDRPGRAVRQAIVGDFGQALSALATPFLPKGAEEFLGIAESKPIGFADIIEQLGFGDFGEEPVTGFGFTGRGALGLGLDILLDPLTYLGAPLGRLAGLGTKAAARTINAANKGLALANVPVLSRLAGFADESADAIGTAFIKDFQLKRGLGAASDPDTLGDVLKLRDEAVSNASSLNIQAASISQQIKKLVSDEESRRFLLDLREVPGFEEEFLINRLGATPQQLRTFDDPTTRTLRRLNLGVTDEQIADVIQTMPTEQVRALELMLTGDPKFALQRRVLPGTRGMAGKVEDIRQAAADPALGRTEQFIDIDHLQDQAIRDLFGRIGVDHVGHFATFGKGAGSLDNFVEAQLKKLVPGGDRITDPKVLLDKAKRLANLNDESAEALQRRKFVGSLNEIEEITGKQLFVRDVADEFVLSSKRFAAVSTMDDFASGLLELDDVARLSDTAFTPQTLPPGMENLPVSKLPRSVRNRLEKQGIMHVAMNSAVATEFFGKGGFVNRMFSLAEGGKLLGALKSFNKLYKPWTLAHPASVTRDAVGDVFLNLVAGVQPLWYRPARTIYKALGDWRAGKPVTGSIELGGQSIPMERVVRDLVDTGIPGHSLSHTEFYNQQFQAVAQGKIRRLARLDPGQNTWTRGVMHAKGWLSDHGRIAHFIQKRYGNKAQGGNLDVMDAMMSVKKHLYDVENLTNFERNVMRETFPFYSWARNNIPNMLEKTLEGTPYWTVGGKQFGPNIPFIFGKQKLQLDERHRADVPDEMMPAFLQGQFTMPVGRDKDGQLSVFALNTWIPVADLSEVDSPSKMIRFMFNSATPLISEPIEQFFNFDAFFKRSIERFEGEREHILGLAVNTRTAKVVRNVRLINEFDRVVIPMINKLFGTEFGLASDRLRDYLGQQEFVELALRASTGIKIRDVDLITAQQRLIRRTNKEIRGIQQQLQFARQGNDQANIQQTQRLLDQKRAVLGTAVNMDPVENPWLGGLTEPDLNVQAGGLPNLAGLR